VNRGSPSCSTQTSSMNSPEKPRGRDDSFSPSSQPLPRTIVTKYGVLPRSLLDSVGHTRELAEHKMAISNPTHFEPWPLLVSPRQSRGTRSESGDGLIAVECARQSTGASKLITRRAAGGGTHSPYPR
jgi:hypothetical protein